MTLIECFSEAHIDNIAACLRLRPKKLIMLGEADKMSAPIERYEKLLRERGLHTEVIACNIQGKDFKDVCASLAALVKQEPDCVIDVTGGDESIIMAVGAMLVGLERNVQRQIRVEKYDHENGVVQDCVNDNRKVQTKAVDLTVAELVSLHGGTIHPNAYQPPKDYSPRDLAGLWDIVSEAPKDWNREIMLLGEFESRADSKTQVFLPLEHLRGKISNLDMKENVVRELLDKLYRRGVIEDHSSRSALEYTYRSQMLRYCTQKAGNVLEMKTLLEGRAVLEKGAPYFRDCQMSVSIDWDGVMHDPAERVPETRNEIDVVLMHGTTPLFISCKNGNIGEDELYKLHTVAERFGGAYAKKMLIATDLERKSPAANRAFIQRAWDMDVFLVTDAAELSEDEWHQIFKKAMQ